MRVGDIAEVSRGWQDPAIAEIGLVDGKRAIIVAARMGREGRIDLWSQEALTVVDDFRAGVGSRDRRST